MSKFGGAMDAMWERGKTAVILRILRRIFNFFMSFDILSSENFGMMVKKASFRDVQTLLASIFLEVNTTLPWGLHMLGMVVKQANAWTRRKDGTINRKLSDWLEIKVPASAIPVDGVSTKDVVIDPGTKVWVRIFTPSQEIDTESSESSEQLLSEPTKKLPVLVYYHGGGFGVLCADFLYCDGFCRTLSREFNMVVVSVNYRKAPENRFPAAYDDSFKAFQWLQSSESAQHLPPTADVSRCFIAGESAGANIVHFMGCRAAETDLGPVRILGSILLQPYMGSQERTPAERTLVNVPMISLNATDWHWKAFLPKGADRDHPACNIFGPNSPNISKLVLPPIFLAIGSLDLLKDHQTRYAWQLRKMGKVLKVKHYNGGIHGFYILERAGTKLGTSCVTDMKEFIQSCLDGSVHLS